MVANNKAMIFLAVAATTAIAAKAVDITYPSDSTLSFTGGTEYTESGDEWNVTHDTPLAVSITGTGNLLHGINKEAHAWRNIVLTGDGYLTMDRDAQWSIGMTWDKNGATKDFEGTLHIKHRNYCQTYFGIGDGTLSFKKGSIVLEAASGNDVYFSNYASVREIGDLSTAGDNPARIRVLKKNGGSLYIGYLNKNSTFGGTFRNHDTTTVFDIHKVGTGTWTLNGEVAITNGALFVDAGTVVVNCGVSSAVTVAANGTIGGNGTITGAVGATTGAKLLFDSAAPDNVLTFTADADLRGFTVDATGLDPAQTYLVAKGTTSLPGVSAAQASLGWMTKAENGNVYLVSNLRTVDADVTLDADTDWSVSPVAVSDNVVIDLNGHDLSVGSIALGEGVTIVNSGANARLYVGLNSADKTWVTNMTLSASIMPVFVGAAIDLSADYIPAGGIGFKDTSGQQPLYNTTCNNGLAFLGGANIIEPWKNWNFGSGKTCTVTVEGENNVFTFNNDNGGTRPGAFTTTPFTGSGTLTIVGSSYGAVGPLIGAKDADNSGFTGKIVLKPVLNYTPQNCYGVKFEDDNNRAKALDAGTVSLAWDGSDTCNFALATQNYGTPPTYDLGNLVTEGSHPELIVLNSRMNQDDKVATIKVGWNDDDGVFSGSFTNYNGEKHWPFNIEKHGAGTWTLAGVVANEGTFTVAAGGVEFRNGLANVTGLTVASGASVLFAGDMGANPISLASGSTLKLDASNEGDNVPVVNGNLNLTGVSVYISQGTYAPDKHVPRELLRVTGTLTGFERNAVSTDIVADGWSFRLVKNADGTTSIFHQYRPGFVMVIS